MSLIAGCGADKTEKVKSFSVGYAKALITPEVSVPLRGYGDAMERFSEGQLEDMYATCVINNCGLQNECSIPSPHHRDYRAQNPPGIF